MNRAVLPRKGGIGLSTHKPNTSSVTHLQQEKKKRWIRGTPEVKPLLFLWTIFVFCCAPDNRNQCSEKLMMSHNHIQAAVLSVFSTCSSSLALVSLKLLSVKGLTAPLCSRPCTCLCQSTSQRSDKPLSDKGGFPAITSTCVTTGGLICRSDVKPS